MWVSLCATALFVGMCHLVMGSTYRPLELACLKALEHACGLQSKRLVSVWGGGGMRHEHSMPCSCMQVFAGFMCDQVKVLMRTILLYSKPETPNIPKVLHSSVSLPSVPSCQPHCMHSPHANYAVCVCQRGCRAGQGLHDLP